MGFFAVLCRQTNIIWIFFIAGTKVFEDFEKKNPAKKNDLFAISKYLFSNLVHIVLRYFTFVCTGLAFVGFAIVNKGIVIGKLYLSSSKPYSLQMTSFP